jgi:two-component sensor histidine kinase
MQAPPLPMKNSSRNYSINSMLAMLGLIGILLVLQAIIRYNDFVSNQQALMGNEVVIAGKEIERLVKELHNEVTIFAEEKYEIINFLDAYPDSEDISTHINKKVAGLFPDYVSVSITDKNAGLRYSSNSLESERACFTGISAYFESGEHTDIHIHEFKGVYHFDVMSNWGRNDIQGILKISFKPEIFSRSIQISEATGHKLVLLHKDRKGLIEISASGARMNPLAGESEQLNEETLKRIGARYDVKGTRWQLVAVANKALYSDQLRFILIQTTTVMFAVALVIFIMLRMILKTDKQREKSEAALYTANEHLQQALDFSKVFMCRWDIKTDELIWSENARQLFAEKIPGHFNSYLQLLNKNQRKKLRQQIDTCLNTNEAYHSEHIVNLPDVGERWLAMSGNFEANSQTGHIEMISLVTDITGRKQAENQRIQAEKTQRETLVREVHHRIKNHLQGVVGLLRQHTLNKPEISDVIDMAAGQLHSVSTVYGLQSREMRAHVSVRELMSEICKANKGMLGADIHYTCIEDTENAVLGEERAVAIALIINELMTNAIKHTPSKDGKDISVNMQVQASRVTIVIENEIDNLPDNFDFTKAVGLGTGLTLIRSLLPNKGAELIIQPEQNRMQAVLTLWSPVVRNEHEQ